MAGAVWDMYTDGDLAGQVVRPLRYTTTQEDSIRVQVFLDLQTQLAEWTRNIRRGLDARRMLLSDVRDEERAASVRDVIANLDDRPRPGVASVDPVEVTTQLDEEGGPQVSVVASATLASGEVLMLGPFVLG